MKTKIFSRNAILVGLGIAGIALTGCGSTGGSTPNPTGTHSTATATGTASPSASPTGPPASTYPATDTPLASAPANLAQAWTLLQVTIIPGLNNFAAHPTVAPITNHTAGAVTDAQAQQITQAQLRSEVLITWALANGQADFLSHVENATTSGGPVLGDLANGAKVTSNDPCEFPLKITLFPITPDAKNYFKGRMNPLDTVVERLDYAPGCKYTGTYPDGHTDVPYSNPNADSTLVLGFVSQDATMGPIFYWDNQGDCVDSNAPLSLCSKSN